MTDDEVFGHVYRTYAKRDMESYYDEFYSERFSDLDRWRKYMSEHGSVGPLLERYLGRFNYTLEFGFEDKAANICFAKSEFINAECYSFTEKYNEAFKMPARIKETWVEWDTEKWHYTCYMYFNEEEMLRVFDEAFGDDRTQKGELRIKVNKENDQFGLSLVVGGKAFKLEKTQINNFVDSVEDPDGDGTLVFGNFEGDHTNYFADDAECLREREEDDDEDDDDDEDSDDSQK